MPKLLDPKRYSAPASQVEDLAYGGELPPPLPARPSAATQTLQAPPAAPIARTDLAGGMRGPGPYGGPLSRADMAARGQQQQAQQNMITQAGASAAGQQLGDVKASPEYRTASAALDAIRQKYGSNREGMFQDPEYKQVTRQMASILNPVDQARMAAIRQTRDVYARANGGFNEADLAAQAVPATVEQWKAGTGQILAQTGAIDAQGNLLNAQAGKTTEEASQVGANAQSTRGVQESEAGLNKAKAEVLPKEVEANEKARTTISRMQQEAQEAQQRMTAQSTELASLKAEIADLRSLLKDNKINMVKVAGGGMETENGEDTSQASTAAPFNGSRSPLQTGAGGGRVATTQPSQQAQPGSFRFNQDGTVTTADGVTRRKGPDGNWYPVQ